MKRSVSLTIQIGQLQLLVFDLAVVFMFTFQFQTIFDWNWFVNCWSSSAKDFVEEWKNSWKNCDHRRLHQFCDLNNESYNIDEKKSVIVHSRKFQLKIWIFQKKSWTIDNIFWNIQISKWNFWQLADKLLSVYNLSFILICVRKCTHISFSCFTSVFLRNQLNSCVLFTHKHIICVWSHRSNYSNKLIMYVVYVCGCVCVWTTRCG